MSIQFLASALGARNVSIIRDLVDDYSAVPNDATSDKTSFLAFRTEFLAEPSRCMLTIPAGTFHFGTGTGVGNIQYWLESVDNAIIAGAGQNETILVGGSTGIQFGGIGVIDNGTAGTFGARCATALIGATSVTLLTEADAAKFTVGQYALMAGIDLMGFGHPPNPHFFDHVIVTAKAGAVISFDRPLTNDYLSTWPLYNDGSAWLTGGGPDQGGPATLYMLQTSWNTEIEVRDLTITQAAFQTYANGRSITYRNVTFTDSHGAIPTQNMLFRYIDCDLSTVNVEVDKAIHRIEATNTPFNHVKFQSSSTNEAVFTDCDVLIDMSGTAKWHWIYGGMIDRFQPGAYAYGSCYQVTIGPSEIGNPVINELSLGGISDTGGPGGDGAGINIEYTMDDDTIIMDHTDGPARWAIPGQWCMWATSVYENVGIFRVLDINEVGDEVHVTTSWSGGFPDPISPATTIAIVTHPCPDWNCTNATGCDDIVDLSQAGAQARPLYEYSRRTFTNPSTTLQPAIRMWGAIVSIKINVTVAHAGAGNPLFQLSQFNNWKMMRADRTLADVNVRINTKITGERVITPSGNSGIQSLDVVPTLAAGDWLTRTTQPYTTAATSGGCTVILEMITDQGIS